MLKRRKFKMKFKKEWVDYDFGHWKEIKDSSLISTLYDLQEKYDFEIVSINIKNSIIYPNVITIKCNREDKNRIFTEYCKQLGKYITEVSF